MNIKENMVESSEISQEITDLRQPIKNTPRLGKISPKRSETEKEANNTLQSDKISPNRKGNINLGPNTQRLGEILPREPQQVVDLVAMEEGTTVQHNEGGVQQRSPQADTEEHYLDDNFSNIMRSSALGSNVSSLFNTRAFNTTTSKPKVTLNWILPDGKNWSYVGISTRLGTIL